MKKITEKQNRKSLSEGRNFGIGFTVLNKQKDNYETYLPFTACRDYLNDFAYVEKTKKEIGTIYGYNHKLLNCFEKKNNIYLGINTLHTKSGGTWNLKDQAQEVLINNRENLQSLLNKVETIFKLRSKSSIELDEDTLIIKCSKYWMKSTALISAYTLLIRCYFDLKYDSEKDLIEQLTAHKCFISADEYLKNNVIEFIKNNNKYKYEDINYDELNIKSNSSVHNFGISGYLNLMKKNEENSKKVS